MIRGKEGGTLNCVSLSEQIKYFNLRPRRADVFGFPSPWEILPRSSSTSRGVCQKLVGHKPRPANWTQRRVTRFQYSPTTPRESFREPRSEKFAPKHSKARRPGNRRAETGSAFEAGVIRSAPATARGDWLEGGRCRPPPPVALGRLSGDPSCVHLRRVSYGRRSPAGFSHS